MNRPNPDALLEKCLAAFAAAGTLNLSLDQLSVRVGVSKRMLIHYFGSREALEIRALALLEDQLRARFSTEAHPSGATLRTVVNALWETSTSAAARGTLQLIMDISRRGWNGSERARDFYAEQQRLWQALLFRYLPDPLAVDELLLLFQGAVLVYLVTGDSRQGSRTLNRLLDRM